MMSELLLRDPDVSVPGLQEAGLGRSKVLADPDVGHPLVLFPRKTQKAHILVQTGSEGPNNDAVIIHRQSVPRDGLMMSETVLGSSCVVPEPEPGV